MAKLIILLFIIVFVAFVIYSVADYLHMLANRSPKLYWCACGCDKQFDLNYGWDGYHGTGGKPYIPGQSGNPDGRKALDYNPDSVIGWEDIQWTVEKRLPKED